MWHRWKNGEITEEENLNGINDSAENAILKELKDTANKLNGKIYSAHVSDIKIYSADQRSVDSQIIYRATDNEASTKTDTKL